MHEGWGVTHYKNNLLISEGSNKIFIVSPNNMTILDIKEIYDCKNNSVNGLNELEIVNDYLFANVFVTNAIAVINTRSWITEKFINLNEIIS